MPKAYSDRGYQIPESQFEKNFTRVIAGLNVGDRVKVNWNYDERKRAAQIQVVSRAKAKPVEKENPPRSQSERLSHRAWRKPAAPIASPKAKSDQ